MVVGKWDVKKNPILMFLPVRWGMTDLVVNKSIFDAGLVDLYILSLL